MRSVAIGLISGMFALTQRDVVFRFNYKHQRRKFRPLMGTIAERLIFRPSTATPPVFSRFERYNCRSLGSNLRFSHARYSFICTHNSDEIVHP